jgi:hypothetical protein
MKEIENLTQTQNGAKAYKSTLNKNLDFFNLAGNYMKEDEIGDLFEDAYFEDSHTAILNLIRIRDIRNGGLGVRSNYRFCLKRLAKLDKKLAIYLAYITPNIGRWDDIFVLLDEDVDSYIREHILNLIENTLHDDTDKVLASIESKNQDLEISLLAKWLPNPKSKNAKTNRYAGLIMKHLKINQRDYRHIKTDLSKFLNVVEQKITTQDYNSIDYSKLPTKALRRYQKLFKRVDGEKFNKYLEDIKNGTQKVKTTGLYPYEIIKPLFTNRDDADLTLIQSLWDGIDRSEIKKNTIVCADCSGSMYTVVNKIEALPLLNSISLAILMSESINGPFKDHFISFGSRPELIDLSTRKRIIDKVGKVSRFSDIDSTDIMAVYELILEASKQITDPKEYIERLIIVSDMQFDQAMTNKAPYEEAKALFDEVKIPFPEVIFWNVKSKNVSIPVKPNECGVKLVSGYSSNIIDELVKSESFDINMEEFMMLCLEPFRQFITITDIY